MTPITNTQHAFSIHHRAFPAQRTPGGARTATAPRRTSAVLSVQELRRIVCEMVD